MITGLLHTYSKDKNDYSTHYTASSMLDYQSKYDGSEESLKEIYNEISVSSRAYAPQQAIINVFPIQSIETEGEEEDAENKDCPVVMSYACNCSVHNLQHFPITIEKLAYYLNQKMSSRASLQLHKDHVCPYCGNDEFRFIGNTLHSLYTNEDEEKIKITAFTLKTNVFYQNPLPNSSVVSAAEEHEREVRLRQEKHFLNTVDVNKDPLSSFKRQSSSSIGSRSYCLSADAASTHFRGKGEEGEYSFFPVQQSTRYTLTFNKRSQKLYLVTTLPSRKSHVRFVSNGQLGAAEHLNIDDGFSVINIKDFSRIGENQYGDAVDTIFENLYNPLRNRSQVTPFEMLSAKMISAFIRSKDSRVRTHSSVATKMFAQGNSTQEILNIIATPVGLTLPGSNIPLSMVPVACRDSKSKALKALLPASSKKSQGLFASSIDDFEKAESRRNSQRDLLGFHQGIEENLMLEDNGLKLSPYNLESHQIRSKEFIFLSAITNSEVLYNCLNNIRVRSSKKGPFTLHLEPHYTARYTNPEQEYKPVKLQTMRNQFARFLKKSFASEKQMNQSLQAVIDEQDPTFYSDLLDNFIRTPKKELDKIASEGIRNMHQLHDKLYMYALSEGKPNKHIEYSKEMLNVFNRKINDYEFYAVQDTKELILVGKQMHHCVGTYDHHLLSGRTIIVVMKNKQTDKYEVCLEIGQSGLNQAKMSYNRLVSKDVNTKLYNVLGAYLQDTPIVSKNALSNDLRHYRDALEPNLSGLVEAYSDEYKKELKKAIEKKEKDEFCRIEAANALHMLAI